MAHDNALAQDFPADNSPNPAGTHLSYPGERLDDGSPGDIIKEKYDATLKKGIEGTYDTARKFSLSSFGKGMLIAAAVVVGVMALVGGYMGATGTLAVGGIPITTLENGIAQGIGKAVEFLTSGMGIATMLAGGGIGLGSEVLSNQRKLAAQQTERLAKEYERSREHAKHKHHDHHHHHHHEKPAPQQKAHGGLDENGIYVSGSHIHKENFCAAELKRRSEREAQPHTGMTCA